MCELTNEEMGATHARPPSSRCTSFCASHICMLDGRPPAMCPRHTRCRIVRVRNIAAEIETARMLNNDPLTPPSHDFCTAEFDGLYKDAAREWDEIFKL